MPVYELLDRKIAIALAGVMIAGGVMQTKPRGDFFRFRGGWKSPVKFEFHHAFNDPRIREMTFGLINLRQVENTVTARTGCEIRDLICLGVPDGAVPWASILAHGLKCKYRLTKKRSVLGATQMTIEDLPEQAKCFGVEDMVTKAGSLAQLAGAAEDTPAEIDYFLALGTYSFKEADSTIANIGVRVDVLVPWYTIMSAIEIHLFERELIDRIHRWHEDPENWDPNA